MYFPDVARPLSFMRQRAVQAVRSRLPPRDRKCTREGTQIWILRCGLVTLLMCASVLGAGDEALPKARRTAPPLKLKRVDFNHPPRQYVLRRAHDWPVWVEEELVDQDAELAKKALHRLDQLLVEVLRALPVQARPVLQRVPFFLMYGERSKYGGRNNGLEYFQRTAPAHFAYLDPRMASSIVIYSATNWVWLPEHRARMALMHELAHAYHLEQWPELRSDIYQAWQHACGEGLYRNVRDEHGRVLKKGYAVQNHLEYFAELSMIYFVGGYYEPFTRDRFKRYDPTGYALIEKLWRIPKPGKQVEPDPGPRVASPKSTNPSNARPAEDKGHSREL